MSFSSLTYQYTSFIDNNSKHDLYNKISRFLSWISGHSLLNLKGSGPWVPRTAEWALVSEVETMEILRGTGGEWRVSMPASGNSMVGKKTIYPFIIYLSAYIPLLVRVCMCVCVYICVCTSTPAFSFPRAIRGWSRRSGERRGLWPPCPLQANSELIGCLGSQIAQSFSLLRFLSLLSLFSPSCLTGPPSLSLSLPDEPTFSL